MDQDIAEMFASRWVERFEDGAEVIVPVGRIMLHGAHLLSNLNHAKDYEHDSRADEN